MSKAARTTGGLHLTRPVNLNGEDYVLHYFDGGMMVTGSPWSGEHVTVPRKFMEPLEHKLREMAGISQDRSTPAGFVLEIAPELVTQIAIQFEGNSCHIGESWSIKVEE